MALKLVYRTETPIPVEIEGFTPDWASDKSLAEIERFEIFHGNRKLPLAELFAISGDPSDRRWDFEGNLAGVHWIGAHMTSGTIHIHGDAGRHVGSQMRGGEILIDGNVSDWVGAHLHRGLIHARGNAGDLVGAAYRGSTKGMTGGSILIDGNAGNEVGLAMRRGIIAIGGSSGHMLGFSLIAGTILVMGQCGIRPGAGMRRGTLGLFGSRRPVLLPSFRYACTAQPQFVPLMLRTVRNQGFQIDPALESSLFDFYRGDLLTVGKGEILFRHPL